MEKRELTGRASLSLKCLSCGSSRIFKARMVTRGDHLDAIVSIDHGKGHSRTTCNFIARTKSENGQWHEDEHVCATGNARCKKDNAEIIQNTFAPLLDADLKIIVGWRCASIVNGQAMFGGHEVAPKMTPIDLFMAGDILFCSMIIGKEGFSAWWCCFCKLFKNDWQQAGHPLHFLSPSDGTPVNSRSPLVNSLSSSPFPLG
jgi:hypothetical protein